MGSSSRIYSLFPAVLVVTTLAPTPAHADIYRFVDARGVVYISNVPIDPRYRLYKRDSRHATRPRWGPTIINVRAASPRHAARFNPVHRRQFTPLVSTVAREQGLEPALLHAIIAVESGYDPNARSTKGAAGLMQLMPGTARRYHVTDIWDPRQNVSGGARYLRDLLALFDNNVGLALAAYNAGESAVIRHGNRIPPYSETRDYVPLVLRHYRLYSGR